MSAFNLLHLVTKSQPVALRACGLPSAFRSTYHQRCMITGGSSRGLKENKRSCRDKKDCKVVFSQEELRKRLTPLQYHVTQEKGTESAFEGEYTHHKAQGIYKCVVCGTPLFKSETKFDSNSGRSVPQGPAPSWEVQHTGSSLWDCSSWAPLSEGREYGAVSHLQ
ncbi:methionine-R-sulfoxide reductase B3 isoform X5 [Gallus gallus]|uniref:methionine-R-sulfoxide reductase B3 isoform X5 n=1 Tax=Gallus gallus TaxID=9031 RepID=UPI001AE66D48|nr:methionine-R-sulfoxide reductase B3 isoform X5 [Gallus gallus]XP_046763227.1 methionine-R-sulfoxide reductase B3 isoform X5 [Gallus gallus]